MASITDTAMLVLYNEALQRVALGQSYQIGGRMLSRADISEIRQTIEWLERRINAAADPVGGLGLVRFEDQV